MIPWHTKTNDASSNVELGNEAWPLMATAHRSITKTAARCTYACADHGVGLGCQRFYSTNCYESLPVRLSIRPQARL